MSLPRRKFLTNGIASGLGLSMANALPLFKEGQAQEAETPLRLITVYMPHNLIHSRWRPRSLTSESYDRYQWDISYPEAVLAPLAPYKDKMLVFDGYDFRVAYQNGGVGGHHGKNGALTGVSYQGNSPHPDFLRDGSIDQFIANRTLSEYPFKSIETGIEYYLFTNSFLPNGTRLSQDPNPLSLFNRLFGQSNQTNDEIAKKAVE